MPIGVSSIIQARLFQRVDNQVVLNVQHYMIEAMEVLSDDLSDYAEPMFTFWESTISPLQSVALTWERCELYEVNGLDFGIYAAPTPVPGEIGGNVNASFVAVSVQQVRASRATRHGWKRFSGVPETSTTGNILIPAMQAAWAAAAEDLFGGAFTLESSEFPETRSITFVPIIWGGNDPGYPLGRYSYIEDVVVKQNITTQNTRKRNRGS